MGAILQDLRVGLRTFVLRLGATSLLLILACANVANLILARGVGRMISRFPLALIAAIAFAGAAPPQAGPSIVPPMLQNATAGAGLTRWTQTFSSAFADLDNDRDDDLVVSNHGIAIKLYINERGRFTDRSDLLPRTNNDRHGLTVYDLDGDGDRDIVLATGGGGLDYSIAPGSASQLFANRLNETGGLAFEDVSAAAGVAFADQRSRWFMPVPAGAGIDLYLEAQFRVGRPNVYLDHLGGLRFRSVARAPLTQDLHSEGKDTLWDYDRDGVIDLLTIVGTHIRVLRGAAGGFREVDFPELAGGRVNAIAAGDLNRDGYPDIYIGGREGRGDRIYLGLPGPASWRRARELPHLVTDHRFELLEDLPHDEWTRSVAMVDLDANGWLDIVVQRGNAVGQPNGSRFVLMSDGAGFARYDLPAAAGGQSDDLVVGFVDDDQRPDLFATNGWGLLPTNVGPYELWLNRTPTPYGQVTVRLRGAAPNTDAIGAQVELQDAAGELLGYRMIAPRGQAQDTTRMHFGVGSDSGPFTLHVRWPEGTRAVRRGLGAGVDATIVERVP